MMKYYDRIAILSFFGILTLSILFAQQSVTYATQKDIIAYNWRS
jgi:hypothetical protein